MPVCVYNCFILCVITERKAHRLYRMMIPWIGTGLLVANDEKWFRSRRLLTPAFHFGVLKPYVQVYNECVQTLIVSVFYIIICINECIKNRGSSRRFLRFPETSHVIEIL